MIADWTGVPLSSLMKDEQTELLTLENEMVKRVVGQDVALEAIAQRLRAAKRGSPPRMARRASFCWWDRAEWGKLKPRLRWPMSCTAVRSHSLRLTSPNTRSRIRFPN